MSVKISIINQEKTKKNIALKGYSIRGFSKRIKVSYSYLSQILSGNRYPSPSIAKKIADGLNEDIEDVFFIKNGNSVTNEEVTNEL